MLSLVVAVFTPLSDRGAFNRALAEVRYDMSPAEVRRRLGPPDDVWTPADSSLYADADTRVWCYGTNGHLTLPTLGRVMFVDGKVAMKTGEGERKPVRDLPPEPELLRYLRAIHNVPTRDYGFDPLQTIRVANRLLPLGKKRALAVMVQYERLQTFTGDAQWLFWVAFVLFRSNRPFPLPAIGAISPQPPKVPATWPTFPILVVDDVPLSFLEGVNIAGYPEPFEFYAARASGDWTMRRAPLRPPDDPFDAYAKALLERSTNHADIGPEMNAGSLQRIQLGNLLRLVREAYPTRSSPYDDARPEAVRALHEAFLKVGARWSPERQRYVRADGTWTPRTEPRYPVQNQHFEAGHRIGVEFVVERKAPQSVDFHVSVTAVRKPIVVTFRVVDEANGMAAFETSKPWEARTSGTFGLRMVGTARTAYPSGDRCRGEDVPEPGVPDLIRRAGGQDLRVARGKGWLVPAPRVHDASRHGAREHDHLPRPVPPVRWRGEGGLSTGAMG